MEVHVCCLLFASWFYIFAPRECEGCRRSTAVGQCKERSQTSAAERNTPGAARDSLMQTISTKNILIYNIYLHIYIYVFLYLDI